MKIIEQGKAPVESWSITCNKCQSKLEYTQVDINYGEEPREGSYIVCPVCKQYLSTYNAVKIS